MLERKRWSQKREKSQWKNAATEEVPKGSNMADRGHAVRNQWEQSGKNVLDSWHINTKTELCGRLSVLHSTCERGDIWLNCWGMCTFTDHYVLDGLSRQRKRELQKVLIKAPSFFYNSGFKARRSDGGFLWELAGFLSWSWYGHGFGRESESLTGVFTVSYTH